MINKRNSILAAGTGAGLLSLTLLALAFAGPAVSRPISNEELSRTSVMVVRADERGGGTGSIISSSPTESLILTNNHVCEAISKGGTVITANGRKHNVTGYRASQLHDLCMISVAANLKVNTATASEAPAPFSDAIVSGHPSLLPNIVTRGHFSERELVNVMTGFRKCTDEDKKRGAELLCMMLGGIPVISRYEAQIISATIQPGSSGSAVYNSRGEISAVVFAGSGPFAYGITVPFEAVNNFVNKEYSTLKTQTPVAADIMEGQGEEGSDHARSSCINLDRRSLESVDGFTKAQIQQVLDTCKILQGDAVLWKN